MPEPLVTCENLVKIYKVADIEAVALQGLDLEVVPGEMLAIVGASGSGKTSLLNILGGLDIPSAGRCRVAGYDLLQLKEAQRVRYRQSVVGHVWQQSGRNLLSHLSAAENITLPQVVVGVNRAQREGRARELLELVGLASRGHHRPDALSGGEQQRAAIAVALANTPALLLADEPTGELDSVTAAAIFDLLRTLNRELGLTIITVTHDSAMAAAADRTIAIRDGRISAETIRRDVPLANVGARAGAVGEVGAVIGLPSVTHLETILVDRVGRLQLPKEVVEEVPFNGHALVRVAGQQVASKHVELWPLSATTEDIP